MHVRNDTVAQASPRPDAHTVSTIAELIEIVGEPTESIANKQTNFLTPLLIEFLQKSPFFLLATAHADGTCDVSPRGDPSGAVHVLDNRTIALPERLGNRRIDSMKNILTNPNVGLLFMIPGVDETVRINGSARITSDPDILATMSMQGKLPNVVIVVEVEEVFTHCARSILRSRLWNPESWPDPSTIPTLVAMMAEQKNLTPPDESLGKRIEEYRSRLY